MTELLTATQMKAIESAAIESGSVTGLELMERAGRGVVDAIFAEWPQLASAPHRAVVLCGPGNNGGDGFVVARLLRDWGWEVEVLFHGELEKLPVDAKTNHDAWAKMGSIQPLNIEAASKGERPTLLVDAMFGTGLTRAIPLELANVFHAIENRAGVNSHSGQVSYYRVAVDCPSGLDCDSGRFLLPERPAGTGDETADAGNWQTWWEEDASKRMLTVDLTAVFHRMKIGHALSESCGRVRIVDIGLGREGRHPAHLKIPRRTDRVVALEFDKPKGPSRRIWPGFDVDKGAGPGEHKYDHGHALILSGSAGRTGAARLAARGALRIGAGLVTLGVPGSAQMEVASHITALMLARVDDGAALAALLEDDRINALAIGPGLGLGDDQAALVETVLNSGRAAVLDADALTLIGRDQDLFALLHEDCVLTPHGGEFARLFPDIAETFAAVPTRGPAYSKVDATRAAAERAGCTVLYKGPDTVIASPDGRCSINSAQYERAAPWLATAGAGDVLTGFVAGLLARGLGPFEAAETAAWLHTECARSFGPGLIAEDLPEQLPQVFRDLGL